jgi:hypothetical protein
MRKRSKIFAVLRSREYFYINIIFKKFRIFSKLVTRGFKRMQRLCSPFSKIRVHAVFLLPIVEN